MKIIGQRIATLETARVRTNTGTVDSIRRIWLEDGSCVSFMVHECEDGYAIGFKRLGGPPPVLKHKWKPAPKGSCEYATSSFVCDVCGMLKKYSPLLPTSFRYSGGGLERTVVAPQTNGGVRTSIPSCPGKKG